MSTNIGPPVRGRSWLFQVTALCIVLGMLLALSLKTQRQAASEGIPNRWPALRTEFRNIKEENEKLQKDVAYYKAHYEDLARDQASGLSSSKGLQQALEDEKLQAGAVSLHGPGIVVTVKDSPKLDPMESNKEVIMQYMVHDSDLRSVVNELFSAGAEAIAINDQRLVANSSIRCVGSTVLVNSERLAPPYRIAAIGKPDVLQSALDLQGGALDIEGLFTLDMIKIEKEPDVTVPAFTGSTRFNVAKH